MEDKDYPVDVTTEGNIKVLSGAGSPFVNDGNVSLVTSRETLTIRGEPVEIMYHYYQCQQTGREFTSSELEEVNLNSAWKKYHEDQNG